MSDLRPDQRPDFCVKVDFEKGSRSPEKILNSMAQFVEAIQSLDLLLVQSVDSKIKPVLLLEEIESGSVKVWLKQFLEAVDDDALKALDWKPAVGKYLVKAKHRTLGYLGENKGLDSSEGLHRLTAELHQMAQETDARKMPAYRPVSPSDMAAQLKRISEPLSLLSVNESISIESDEGDSTAHGTPSITQEDIANVLAGDSITNEVEKILIVRKPDFLGDTQWDFRHEKKRFTARIDDTDWLAEFRSGEAVIRPGDALRVKTLETITYGKDGEVLSEESSIAKVIGVIREFAPQLPIEWDA